MVREVTKAADKTSFVLPAVVVGQVDVSRLERELSDLNDALAQDAIRHAKVGKVIPRGSPLLEELARANKLDLGQSAEREQLVAFLGQLKHQAPTLHMSFAADPSASFIGKIMTWLRQEIHPYALLQIGLQPNIAAGTVLRTPSRVFDFSLRKHFTANRDLLIEKIGDQGE